MGYSVYRFQDGGISEAVGGLTLKEAFTRLMAFADCAYRFYRDNGVMRLEITHLIPPSARDLADPEFLDEFYANYHSTLRDNEQARADIMRRFLSRGLNGYIIRSETSPSPPAMPRARGGTESVGTDGTA